MTAENQALKLELEAIKAKVPTEEKRWFTTAEAAKYIGRSPGFLNKDRLLTTPSIPFSKRGHRTLLYDRADLDKFIEDRRVKKSKR